uniref:Uncharacterized protein n=1 Tax=Plectus sambesii TaxID=2011161 RepID=A0A914XNQ1_9BILA
MSHHHKGPIEAVKDFAHTVSEKLKMDKSEEERFSVGKPLTPAEHHLLAEQTKYALEENGEPFSDLGSKIVITKIEKA